jgi:hypothetical protein
VVTLEFIGVLTLRAARTSYLRVASSSASTSTNHTSSDTATSLSGRQENPTRAELAAAWIHVRSSNPGQAVKGSLLRLRRP